MVEKHRSKTVHILIQTLGFLSLIAGVIMLITPGPGWLLIIIGVVLLGEESPLGGWIISKLPHRIREEIRKRQHRD